MDLSINGLQYLYLFAYFSATTLRLRPFVSVEFNRVCTCCCRNVANAEPLQLSAPDQLTAVPACYFSMHCISEYHHHLIRKADRNKFIHKCCRDSRKYQAEECCPWHNNVRMAIFQWQLFLLSAVWIFPYLWAEYNIKKVILSWDPFPKYLTIRFIWGFS